MKNRVLKVCNYNDTRLTIYNDGIEIFKKIDADNFKIKIEATYLRGIVEKQILPVIERNNNTEEKEKINIIVRSRKIKPGDPYSPDFKIKFELDDIFVHHILVLYSYLYNRSKFITHFIYGLDQYTNNSFDIIDNNDVNDPNDDHSNGTSIDNSAHTVYKYNIKNIVFDELNDFTNKFDNIYHDETSSNIYFDKNNGIYYITNRSLYNRLYTFIVRNTFLRSYFAAEGKITFDKLERFYDLITRGFYVYAAITIVFGDWSIYNDEYKKFVSYFGDLGGLISKFIENNNKDEYYSKCVKNKSKLSKGLKVKDITNLMKEQDRMVSPIDEDDETAK